VSSCNGTHQGSKRIVVQIAKQWVIETDWVICVLVVLVVSSAKFVGRVSEW
jgi:hypothetical protein